MAIEIVDRPSPNHSVRAERVELIVIHGDAGKTDEGTLSWCANPASKVSYHYLVGRDGRIYRMVPESRVAWHAGESQWAGRPHCNRWSVGIAIANDGTGQEPYREVQYAHAARLIYAVMMRHNVPLHRIRGHYEISPGRKTDPWPWWDWDRFHELLAREARGITA